MDRRGFIKVSGWTALGLAATGSILSCARTPGKDLKRLPNEARKRFDAIGDLKIYWGDIHNHCNVTYGHGDLLDALAAAKEQLDFCSVTPHAMWPDIPKMEDPRLDWVIDYHKSAFKRLREGGWEKYVEKLK